MTLKLFSSIEIPRLETPRLILRGHTPQDFAASAALWADPKVVQFIGGRPSTPEESWGRLLRYAGLWSLLGYGYWAVEEKATGTFLGEIGLADFKRELTPSIAGLPEAGWVLAPHAHGKGFATEAVLKVLEWADTHAKFKKTVCIIDPTHTASIRVAQKVAYVQQAATSYKGMPTLLFSRTP